MEKIENIEKLVVHHTSNNYDFPWLVRQKHKHLRKWEDTGYHFLIGNGVLTKDGKVYGGRPEEYVGAHAFGHNQDSLGIVLVGNLEKKMPTEKQMQALVEILVEKAKQYGVTPENILGHRELEGTDTLCPGKNIDMDLVRKSVEDRL